MRGREVLPTLALFLSPPDAPARLSVRVAMALRGHPGSDCYKDRLKYRPPNAI